MSLDNKPVYTGGCQCGAVRFRVDGALGRASICHCRMCQKAFGNFFASLVTVELDRLSWTKAEPARFRSSQEALRGFCPACGTPLTYEAQGAVEIAIGAFDDPSSIAPVKQFGMEGKLPFVDDLAGLPRRTTEEDAAAEPFLARVQSLQHPDHD